MKKYLLLFGLFTVILSSCQKAPIFSPAQQAISDDQSIQNYILTNKITATKDPSGLYYSVITPGTGAYPSATSNVTVNYSGKLLDGTVFDTEPSSYFSLNGGVIQGWTIGLQHINTGGTILLLIPSALGYGINTTGTIPANSVLIFTITLQGFNNSTI
jgi:FKBP-type peptidyl-prolyl cis-trans isomerase FkpA